MAKEDFDTTTDLERMLDMPFGMQAGWPMWAPFRTLAPTMWTPSLELVQKEHQLVARIEVPGMKKDEIAIEVADGRLTIRGERRREQDVRKEHVFRSEREYGTFSRTFTLPEGVHPEAITATMTDGVLEIVVPLPVKAAAPPVAKVPIGDGTRAA